MSSWCDPCGFPVIPVESLGLSVHLLPVAKVQFERFLAEPNDYGDSWYEELLALNPRSSHTRLDNETRERAFLTGVVPEEARAFAKDENLHLVSTVQQGTGRDKTIAPVVADATGNDNLTRTAEVPLANVCDSPAGDLHHGAARNA